MLSQADTDKVISYLHDEGVSLIDSIKVIKKVYNLPLEEAKKMVSTHVLWSHSIDYAPLFLQTIELGPDSTYGDWLEVYLFGFPQKGNFHVTVDKITQKKVSALLKNIVSADKKLQDNLIQDIARHEEKILDALIILLEQGDPALFGLIFAIIRKIGAPENLRAIPWLIDMAIDQELVAMQGARNILKEMDSKAVNPFFTAILLNRNGEKSERIKNKNSTCQLLLQKREWVLACGPVIAFLLAQEDDREKNSIDKKLFLSALEFLAPACAYAIPAIFHIAMAEENSELIPQAKSLLKMFNNDDLEPYRYSVEFS